MFLEAGHMKIAVSHKNKMTNIDCAIYLNSMVSMSFRLKTVKPPEGLRLIQMPECFDALIVIMTGLNIGEPPNRVD